MTPTMTFPEAHTIAMLRMHFKCTYSKIAVVARAIWSNNDLQVMCRADATGTPLGRALVNAMEDTLDITRGATDTMHMNEVACPHCKQTQVSIYFNDTPTLECANCHGAIPAMPVMDDGTNPDKTKSLLRVLLGNTINRTVRTEITLKPQPPPEQFTFLVRAGHGPTAVTADAVFENAEYVRFSLGGKPVACFSRVLFKSYERKENPKPEYETLFNGLLDALRVQSEAMRRIATDTEKSMSAEVNPPRISFYEGRVACLREQAMNIDDIVSRSTRQPQPPRPAAI